MLNVFFFVVLGFCFRHIQIEDDRDDAAHDGVHDEEHHEGAAGKETANAWSDDPGQITNDAHQSKTFLPLFFIQNIRHHGLIGRTGNIGEESDERGEWEEHCQ